MVKLEELRAKILSDPEARAAYEDEKKILKSELEREQPLAQTAKRRADGFGAARRNPSI